MTDSSYAEIIKKKQAKLMDMQSIEDQALQQLRISLKTARSFGFLENEISEPASTTSLSTTFDHTVMALEGAVALMQCLAQSIQMIEKDSPTNLALYTVKKDLRKILFHLYLALEPALAFNNGSR